MKILADYHTHTTYSHGKGSIEDNVKAAISKNLKTIGISDHGYKHLTYGVKYDNIARMKEEINQLNEKYKEIEILLGIEANILDNKGNIDIDDNISNIVDYVMAGYHFGSKPTNIKGGFNHALNYTKLTKYTIDYNTEAVINAMKNNNIFVITHPGDKGPVNIIEVAKVAKKTNTNLEINSHHDHLNVSQLKEIKSIENTFIIGSDAHNPKDIANFVEAIKTAQKANIDFKYIKNISY